MIYLSRHRVGATEADPLNERLVRHVQQQKDVRSDTRGGQRSRLGGGARKAIEEPSLGDDVRLLKLLGHDGDDELIGHELTSRHAGLRLLAKLRARLHLLAQDVSGADVHNSIRADDEFALRAFATPGGTGNDYFWGHLIRMCLVRRPPL